MAHNNHLVRLVALAVLAALLGIAAGESEAASQLSWSTASPMPIANRAMAVGVSGTDIYVAGGGPGPCVFTDRAFHYDSMTDVWDEVESMSVSRDTLGGAVVGGDFYAVAGNTACGVNFTSAVESYDPGSDTWSSASSLASARAAPVAVAYAGELYVFGGVPADTDARKYNPGSDTWTALTPPPEPITCLGDPCAVAMGSTIYVIRGGGEEVLEYHPGTDAWSLGSPMPSSRDGFGVAAIGQDVYVVGGHIVSPESYPTDILIYNTATDAWSSIAPDGPWFTGRTGIAVAAAGGNIFAIGGTRGLASPTIIYDLVEVATLGSPEPPVGGVVEMLSDDGAGGNEPLGAVPLLAGIVAALVFGSTAVGFYRRSQRE